MVGRKLASALPARRDTPQTIATRSGVSATTKPPSDSHRQDPAAFATTGSDATSPRHRNGTRSQPPASILDDTGWHETAGHRGVTGTRAGIPKRVSILRAPTRICWRGSRRPGLFDYLARLRWPEGFVCPACAETRFWRTDIRLWMCRGRGRRTSVTAGTVFHRTRTPLSTWFAASWFVTSARERHLGPGLRRGVGLQVLRDGPGLDAQAAPRDGPP
jgi:hypothetical protein